MASVSAHGVKLLGASMRRRDFITRLGAAAASAAWPTVAGAAAEVDLLLVLAMDVSRSMDQAKFLLQREGYAAAISDVQVLNAIASGPHQKIAVCFVDWS